VVAAGVVLLVTSCSMFAPADWSIRAENDAFDLVLRYVEDGVPSYFEFSNADGVVAFGKGAPPTTISIATLDPASCRPIGEVYGLSTSHIAVGVSFGGTITAGGYDPEDFGEDWGLSDRLTPTDRCSDSDPSTTPAPAPAMSVGDWLDGSEMACRTAGDPDVFHVRGEFLDGAVNGCEAWAGTAGRPVPKAGVVAWNPDGDGLRVAVAWRDARCVSGATVSLYPHDDHYSLNVISIGTACRPPRSVYQAVFHLTDPVDAADVVATLDIVFDPD
jgi:hypothetical protein